MAVGMKPYVGAVRVGGRVVLSARLFHAAPNGGLVMIHVHAPIRRAVMIARIFR